MARQHIVHAPADRPDVEVLHEGTWCAGEVRMSTQDDDGSWRFNVQYRRPDGHTYLDNFTENQVRKDTVDRSSSRG